MPEIKPRPYTAPRDEQGNLLTPSGIVLTKDMDSYLRSSLSAHFRMAAASSGVAFIAVFVLNLIGAPGELLLGISAGISAGCGFRAMRPHYQRLIQIDEDLRKHGFRSLDQYYRWAADHPNPAHRT